MVIKVKDRSYEVPVDGVLRWGLQDGAVFHISPLADGSLTVFVCDNNDQPYDVEFGAHEIKPICPTCRKEY